MALEKPYLDVPGTIIFDAEQSRKGYWLNQFCMSLMKAENRERFKANERAYLDEWPMTEDQKQAVLARDLDVPVNRVTAIINGQRGVTADTALRLARFFGTSAEFWMNLQMTYDLRNAEKALPARVRKSIEQNRGALA